MKRITLALAVILVSLQLVAQAPQGFNYQAVARDNKGEAMVTSSLKVRIGILNETGLAWQEDHQVQTNDLGLFTLQVGDASAANSGGSAASFSGILWREGAYSIEVSIDLGSGFVSMGASQLLSVPYALFAQNGPSGTFGESGWSVNGDTISTNSSVGIGTSNPNQSLLAIQANDPQVENALFEVRNDAGIPVFAVFNDGVIVYVDENKKGRKGGFAVGGYNANDKGVTQEYLRVTPDSVRIWVPETLPAKGKKGGFAVGGYNASSKGTSNQIMELTRQNYLIGQDAGSNITTGINNTFFGWKTGLNNTTGNDNIFIGKLSGSNNFEASENIFIGNQSGYNTILGYGNIYLGNQSGFQNTYGNNNSIIGYQAGFSSESNYNTFLGYQSGYHNTSGENNIALGYQAGYGLPIDGEGVTGDDNIFMGYGAGTSASSGSNNIFMGTYTGYSNTTGTDNIFMGNNSGYSNSDGSFNMYLGYQSGFYSGDGITSDPSYNTFIGYQAGYSNVSGELLTVLGSRAGVYATGSFNTFLGAESGFNADAGTNNTYVGAGAGSSNSGSFNTLLGYSAGFEGQGDGNVLIGMSAGQGSTGSTTFSHNTFVGTKSGIASSTGSQNTFLGYQTGKSNTTGSGNVFLGYEAGLNETGDEKLYISNSSTETPILYGDFSTSNLTMNGNMGINSPGVEGVGLWVDTPASQTQQWAIYGIGDASFSGSVFTASDAAYKKNIVLVDQAISKLKQINGVYFEYDENAPGAKSGGKESIGVIAQDVEKIFPTLVKENLQGLKSVNYSGLIPVLIEAVKDQQSQIELQQSMIVKQQEQIDLLKAALGL